jgi:hypothetical protein
MHYINVNHGMYMISFLSREKICRTAVILKCYESTVLAYRRGGSTYVAHQYAVEEQWHLVKIASSICMFMKFRKKCMTGRQLPWIVLSWPRMAFRQHTRSSSPGPSRQRVPLARLFSATISWCVGAHQVKSTWTTTNVPGEGQFGHLLCK